ncbi:MULTISPECIES: hypothetical protein [Pseudomonas]|uniref:Uncharacterized protein n=1 Tax=Pseudomonas sp. Hg7Tf TaxID=3236988 RepID=A0AB39I129_9PSED|nr:MULTISPECIES: hypothetical protein [Pseudomonas]KJK09660.1 hypothetical protein UB47_01410 [Pseudomonas sp. 5]MDD1979595.1 hypothetical protein [Pseudomonas putida]MDH2558137.1 hypothetical protein [Pseudomonas sp. Hg5Tf]QYX48072.1 hypothetical protein K3F43_00660 [Pseudomonas sp. S11A 273]
MTSVQGQRFDQRIDDGHHGQLSGNLIIGQVTYREKNGASRFVTAFPEAIRPDQCSDKYRLDAGNSQG